MDAIYVRQSLDKKDSLSVEGQTELCRRCAGDNVEVFQDRGYSGKNTKRPAFQKLMQAVEQGQVEKILVYRLDRFSRSLADFSRIWETLESHGVEFLSVTEQFDTSSPMGRAMLNVVMTFAQLERETTAQRVRDNYLHRFALGSWPGGPAPYGFDLTRIRDGEGRPISVLISNNQSAMVQAIFRRYPQPEVSLRRLANDLTREGVPGPRRKEWDSVTLSRLLHSPLYVKATREVYWHYLGQGVSILQPPEAFDGHHACQLIGQRNRTGQQLSLSCHEGIVDADLWLRVQKKLIGNRQLSRTRAGTHTWLTGLLKCGVCGYAVKVNSTGGRFYLLCSGRSNLSCCDASISIDLRELETAVGQAIQSVLRQHPAEPGLPGRASSAHDEEIQEKLRRLIRALAESSQETARLITDEIDRLQQELKELRQESSPALPARLDFFSMSRDEKKLVAAAFLQRISLKGRETTLHWNM